MPLHTCDYSPVPGPWNQAVLFPGEQFQVGVAASPSGDQWLAKAPGVFSSGSGRTQMP